MKQLYQLGGQDAQEKRNIYYVPRNCKMHLVLSYLDYEKRRDSPLKGKVHIRLTHHRSEACEEKLHFSELDLHLLEPSFLPDRSRRQCMVKPNHWRVKGNNICTIPIQFSSDAVHYTYDRNCVNCFTLLSISGCLNGDDILNSCLFRII